MRRGKCLRRREQGQRMEKSIDSHNRVAMLLREYTCALSYYIIIDAIRKLQLDVSFIFEKLLWQTVELHPLPLASRMFANTTGKLFAFIKL